MSIKQQRYFFSLKSIAVSLKRISEESESDFLKIGQRLQSYFYEADDLTKKIIKTIHLLHNNSGQDLSEKIANQSKKTLLEIHEFQEKIPDSIANMDHIIGNLEILFIKCQQIKKIAYFIKIIALNMGIESSRSIFSKEQFSTVAQEIKDLSQRITEIIDPIHSDFFKSKTNQIKARKSIADGLTSLRELEKEAVDMRHRALEKIERLMTLSIKALRNAENQSREISTQIGEIVTGIQLHDSMRQRIEQIRNSISDVIGLCSGNDPDMTGDITPEGGLEQAHFILKLQSAHIEQIISEIKNVHEKSSLAFEKIGIHIGLLSDSLSDIGTSDKDSDNAEKIMNDLRDILVHMNGLLQKSSGLADRIGQMAGKTYKMSDRFTSYMKDIKEISFEMHLKALNAIIMSTHLGETGKTQDIIACELKDRSIETGNFANQIVEILEDITNLALVLKNMKDLKDSTYDKEGNTLEKVISNLSKVFENFKNESSQAKSQVEELRQSRIRIKSGLEFLPDLAGQLKRLLNDLEQIKKIMNPDESRRDSLLKDVEEKISQKYTMDQERQTHKKIIRNRKDFFPETVEENKNVVIKGETGGEAMSHKVSKVIHESTKDKDGLGDNVELF